VADLLQIPESGQIDRVGQRQYLIDEVLPPPRARLARDHHQPIRAALLLHRGRNHRPRPNYYRQTHLVTQGSARHSGRVTGSLVPQRPRVPLGIYRGLRFGLVLHPQFPPEVYLYLEGTVSPRFRRSTGGRVPS
jgi:hypothetical protein